MKRRKTLKGLVTSLGFAAVGVLSVVANAAPLDLSKLPLQAAPTLPQLADAPQVLPSAARVEGLFVGDTRIYNEEEYNYRALGIFVDAEAAERFARQSYYNSEVSIPKPSDRCFSVAPLYPDMPVDPTADWEATLARHAEIQLYDGSPGMNALRVERIVRDGSAVFVEGLEFWVDTKTGGMRVIDTNQLELHEVATPLDGMEVFVARTGEDQVDVVVTRRPNKVEQSLVDTLDGQPLHVLASLNLIPTLNGAVGQKGISSDCGHARFRMRVTEPPKTGESFDSFSFFAARRETAVVNASALLGYTSESPPRLSQLEGSKPRLSVLRQRPLAINLGLSKMSADDHPILSVSYQWSGREATVFAGDIVNSLEL